jgi:hypothetical protein
MKPFTHAPALGIYPWVPTGGSSKRLFCFLRNRSRVGDPYGRREGYGTTVGKRERVPGAAKIEPLRERLSGMCGSVRH